jgi:radical SAM superfamily enzyme YgiQ (UPF0313 family)
MRIDLIAPNETRITGDRLPFLGLLLIASELRKYDYRVKYIDALALKLEESELFKKILVNKPEIIGIYHTITNEQYVLNLLRKIKNNRETKKIIIILGGPQASSTYTNFFKQNKELIDYMSFGEGETTFKILVDSIKNGESLNKVEGIAYKNNNQIIINKRRSMISNINKIAFPAYDLLPELKYYSARSRTKNFMTINTSRGCKEKCIYCHKSTFGYSIRFNSHQYVTELIRFLTKKYNIKELMVVEDNFADDYNRAIKIANTIRDNFNIQIKFMTGIRINTLDKKLLIALKKAGCYHFLFGLESGDKDMRERMKKVIDIPHTKKVIKWARELEISTTAGIIIGLPGETKESFRKTIDLIKDLNPNYATFFWFMPLQDTESFNLASNNGNFTKDYPIDSFIKPNWIPNGWSKGNLKRARSSALREFYSTKKKIWLGLKVIQNSTLREFIFRVKDSFTLFAR